MLSGLASLFFGDNDDDCKAENPSTCNVMNLKTSSVEDEWELVDQSSVTSSRHASPHPFHVHETNNRQVVATPSWNQNSKLSADEFDEDLPAGFEEKENANVVAPRPVDKKANAVTGGHFQPLYRCQKPRNCFPNVHPGVKDLAANGCLKRINSTKAASRRKFHLQQPSVRGKFDRKC